MATRFYLSSTDAPSLTPGFAAWSRTTEALRRVMDTAKDASASTSTTIWANGTVAASDSALARQFHSKRKIKTGTAFLITDTIKAQVRCQESGTNDNINRQPICVKVYNETTLQATFVALAHIGPNTTEWLNTGPRNKIVADGDLLTGIGVTYTSVVGDYLVVELGGQVSTAGGSTVTGTQWYGSDNANDLGENETDTTALNPWFEISTTVAFEGLGSLAVTLGAMTAAGTGTVDVQGTLASTLGTMTLAGTGTVDIQGALASTLDALTLAGTGTVEDAGINGTLDVTLGAMVLAGTGTVDVQGVLSSTLGALTLAGTGTVDVQGSLSSTFDALTLAGTATNEIQGSLNSTLEAMALAGTGIVDVQGSLSITLGALTLSGTATNEIQGALAATLDALTLVGTGTVEDAGGISGVLDVTLGALTLAGTGTVDVQGTLVSTLGTLTLSAAGMVDVAGALAATFGELTLTGTGTVQDAGSESAMILFGAVIQTSHWFRETVPAITGRMSGVYFSVSFPSNAGRRKNRGSDMIASGAVRGRGIAKSGTVLLARIVGYSNVPILQASMASIEFLLHDLTAGTSGAQSALTISSVVFDALQTTAIDPAWIEDDIGYNFRYVVPATDLTWTPVLDVVGNPIPHQFQADVQFTPATGEPFVVPFFFWAIPTYIG